jgi:hypothetical protein
MGHKGHPANFTSNGLFELRAHNPACPRDTRSNTENTMGQNQDAEPETSVSAEGGTVSQGSSSIDREENKKVPLHALNTQEKTTSSHIKEETPSNPVPTATRPDDLPDWLVI